MYNLRSCSQPTSSVDVIAATDDPKEQTSRRKRTGVPLDNGRKKIQKLVEKDEFNPALFNKGNEYNGIYDSSDSESGKEEFVNGTEDVSSPEDQETSSDEVSDSNSEEYFDADTNPLMTIIAKRLKDKFPDLPEDGVNAAIERALKRARADLVDEYCEFEPKDTSWKMDLHDNEIDILEPELKQLRENIKETRPSIPKILRSGLSVKEKERALQLYDALKTSQPHTLDYMYLSMKISDMIRCAPSGLDSETNEKLKRLREKMEAAMPSVEKIVGARITESDKIRALQLYEVLQQCDFNSDEWFDTRRRINNILEAQLNSIEEVEQMETEEATMKDVTISYHADLKRKIFELDADLPIKTRIYEMYTEMISSSVSDSKYSDLKDKIIWAIKLPHRRTLPSLLTDKTPEGIKNYCCTVYQCLDTEIYGMKEAKERAIQAVNDRIYNPNSRAMLALKGKPGVGKTKLAKTIAKAAGLPFDKISLGGAIDSTIFKGSDNVWSGATPSMLLQILSRVKYSNAVILLDEIDKLGTSEKGLEVQHALLHILDPTQSSEFQDSFLSEFPHDISKIWFIPAMNDDSRLDPALRDRLNIIEVPSYTSDDMIEIIKRHTLPEMLIDKGIEITDITITDDATRALLLLLGEEVKDSGMRTVERAITDIVSKINLLRTLLGDEASLPLTFKLPDFKGFPYIITSKTIYSLYKSQNNRGSYLPMYA